MILTNNYLFSIGIFNSGIIFIDKMVLDQLYGER